MSSEKKSRDRIVSDWFRKDTLGHTGSLIKPEGHQMYMNTLIDVVATDGILSEQEREWVIGFAAMCGTSQEVLHHLETYQPETCPHVKNVFQNIDLSYIKKTGLSIIYNGFRAAGADGELHPKELEAIYALAKKLGITDAQVQKVRALYEEENKLREKRTQILFPESFDDTLN